MIILNINSHDTFIIITILSTKRDQEPFYQNGHEQTIGRLNLHPHTVIFSVQSQINGPHTVSIVVHIQLNSTWTIITVELEYMSYVQYYINRNSRIVELPSN